MRFRGFISADLPRLEPLEIVLRELRTSGADLRLVPTEHLHATLKFLGDTDDRLVPEIVQILRDACWDLRTFPGRIQGAGAFPALSRMNVIWIGIGGADALGRIAGILDERLADLGFPRERRQWVPHVTIARVKGGRNLDRVRQILQAHAQDMFGEAIVDAIRLKRSVLSPSGSTYSDVEVVRLPG